MKYFIKEIKNKRHQHAGSKAVNDVNSILSSMGYMPLCWRTEFAVHAVKYVSELLFYRMILSRTTPDDTILLQWPDYDIKYLSRLYKVLSLRPHLQILIHDINSLRNFGRGDRMEQEFFSLAEKLIVHTEAMKDYCVSLGVDPNRIEILTAFDYLTQYVPSDTAVSVDEMHSVAYAGNLEKSVFLHNIGRHFFDDKITLNCYGANSEKIGRGCNYCMRFNPDDIGVLKGGWGLVWDGTSTESCVGDFGDYLRYNSPHKLSLYLAAGIPVIIWSKAALAEYITSNNLGIAIESLHDIPERIGDISAEQYKIIKRAAIQEGARLRAGEHLRNCL